MPMAPLSTYQDAIVDRYKSPDGTPDYERSWSYLDKIIAREMGKAGGLLTFNAVLIAVALATGPWWSVICPVVACLVLLLLMGGSRETPTDMATPRTDCMGAWRPGGPGVARGGASVLSSALGVLY